MNRSILIIIVDFLLVSLMAFSNLESLTLEPAERRLEIAPVPTEVGGKHDLLRTLKLALDSEQRNREKLAAELAKTRESVESQVAERDTKIQQFEENQRRSEKEFEENLRRREEEARQLAQERAALQQQVTAAQTNLQSLQAALAATRSEAKLTRDQLQASQADMRKREAEGETLRQRLANLERSHSNAVATRQQLDTKLKVAEAEKRLTSEQLSTMRTEVQTVRAEKAQLQATTAKLTEGVSTLAEKSTALTQEIREHRPLAANAIFNEFNRNRIQTRFEGIRAGAFGLEAKKEKSAQTVLITDGAQTCAIYHIADTPLTLWPPGTDWHSLTGIISRGQYSYAISRLSFLAQDPRIVVVPVDAAQARQLGGKIYKIASDPFKFPDALLVGANEGYYGECKFQIDTT
ncbi:MAG: hypothetical protein L0Z50_16475, partial [Verrucomicrobiales bacterium]|nr:hypothetical protein [Verrucomicrobiales bacterium]